MVRQDHLVVHYPFNGFMVWWFFIVFSIFAAFGLLIKHIVSNIKPDNMNNPQNDISRLKKFILEIRKESPYREQIPIKMEIFRKSFHLIGLLFIFGYFGFIFLPPITELANIGIYIFIDTTKALYNFLWGSLSNYPYLEGGLEAINYISLFALLGAFIFMIISDLIRVLWGPEYSIFHFITKSTLRNEERNAVGPQIYLIVGAIFTYVLFLIGFVDILAFTAGLIIACLSDALAALVGRIWGQRKVICPGGHEKTIEGFIAGTLSAYLLGLMFLGPIYALVAAIIFLITDYFPMMIADNFLNPILIPIGIMVVQLIIQLPIGWGFF
jgi:dolichol kinase